MRISIFNSKDAWGVGAADEVREVEFDDLPQIVTATTWAPGTYHFTHWVDNKGRPKEGMRRLSDNLISMALFVADVDEGCTIEEARQIFSPYKAIIGTSKSHQKEKTKPSGAVQPACDRFRVIIPLDKQITNDADFKATWHEVQKLCPHIDPACKDAARFYYQCRDIVGQWDGKPFPVALATKRNWQVINSAGPQYANNSNEKGDLSRATLKFIAEGAPAGQWHGALFKAAVDLKEQLYSYDEAIAQLSKATGQLDNHDIQCIRDVYENRPSKYPPRILASNETPESVSNIAFTLPEPAYLKQRYDEQKLAHEQALKNAVPFICDSFDEQNFRLTRGLTVVGAQTGRSKTTTACNILARFYKEQGHNTTYKHALVITNEARLEQYYNLIICILQKRSYGQFYERTMPKKIIDGIELSAKELTQYLRVVDNKQIDTTCLEDVIQTLEYVKTNSNIGIVIIDYVQKILNSRDEPSLKPMEISKKFSEYMKNFANDCTTPIVTLGQLTPKTGPNQEFSSRFQNDHTFVNDADNVIELIPNFETKLTEFIIHKARDPMAPIARPIVVKFVDGRYEKANQEDIEKLKETQQTKKSKQKDEPLLQEVQIKNGENAKEIISQLVAR